MEQLITIHYKAFSINAMYCKTRNYTTSAYKDWSYNILNKLGDSNNQVAMEKLRDLFDPKEHRYTLDLTFYFPKRTLITQQ